MRPFMAWPQPELPVLFPIIPWAPSQAFFALGHTPLFQDPEPLHMPISSFLLPLIQQTKHLLCAKIMQVITTQFDKNSNQHILLQYPVGIQNGGRTCSFWGVGGRGQGEESWRFHIGTDLWAEFKESASQGRGRKSPNDLWLLSLTTLRHQVLASILHPKSLLHLCPLIPPAVVQVPQAPLGLLLQSHCQSFFPSFFQLPIHCLCSCQSELPHCKSEVALPYSKLNS